MDNVATVMRILDTVLVLNDEVVGSKAALDKAFAKIEKLKGKKCKSEE